MVYHIWRVPAGRVVAMAMLAVLAVCLIDLLDATVAEATVAAGHGRHCGVLHLDSTGPCVKTLQRRLDSQHVAPRVDVDGTFGKRTRRAVKNFQREHGLSVDGIAGERTMRVLKRLSQHNGITDKFENITNHAWNTAGRNTSTKIAFILGITTLLALTLILLSLKSLTKNPNFHSAKMTYSSGNSVAVGIVHYPSPTIVRGYVTSAYLNAPSKYGNVSQAPSPAQMLRSIEGWPTA